MNSKQGNQINNLLPLLSLYTATGDMGDVGQSGPSGDKGQAGMKGEPAATISNSAFTAIKTSSQTGNVGDVVTFQQTPTNVNHHFSMTTNKFRCVYPGAYFFSFTVGCYNPNSNDEIFINLEKYGNRVVTAHTRVGGFSDDFDSASASAVLNLAVGDTVWLEFAVTDNRNIFSDAHVRTHFSGFRIF